ncbi:MAG: hypothetical protein JWM27_3816 [Gemmatimonadetes bacterium]|nr:hypothetical protein [Gemmatimonadota bacterium]
MERGCCWRSTTRRRSRQSTVGVRGKLQRPCWRAVSVHAGHIRRAIRRLRAEIPEQLPLLATGTSCGRSSPALRDAAAQAAHPPSPPATAMPFVRISVAELLGIDAASVEVGVAPSCALEFATTSSRTREALLRDDAALRASGFVLPNGRFTVNDVSVMARDGSSTRRWPSRYSRRAGSSSRNGSHATALSASWHWTGCFAPSAAAIILASAAPALGRAGIILPQQQRTRGRRRQRFRGP